MRDQDRFRGCLIGGAAGDALGYAYYDSLPVAEQKAYKEKNWEQVFDITPFENDWTRRGDWVQATVWELRKDMIRDARFFRTGKYKKT